MYKTSNYGRMMTLDGVIQSTERDEHAYVSASLAMHACRIQLFTQVRGRRAFRSQDFCIMLTFTNRTIYMCSMR